MLKTRRHVLATGGLALAGVWIAAATRGIAAAPASPAHFEVSRSDAQWREQLTAAQYAVLRQQATERPYSSPLNDEHRRGVFACAGCALPLYASSTKFDSRTGWPSFWAPLKNAIGEDRDLTLGMVRTEVHCRRCGGHLGHVFDDGPPPTGKRYCMNGAAMTFTAA